VGLSGATPGENMLAKLPLVEEVLDLATGRLCQGQRRRACRMENGTFAEWACRECREFRQPESISPWTWHLLLLHQLKEAGYPFKANDLSLETWMLLGLVHRLYAAGRSTITMGKATPSLARDLTDEESR